MFIKLQRWLGAAIIVSLLSGCGDEITSSSANAQTNNDNATSTTNKNRLTISNKGVGPINSTTRFNIHDITVAFPNYSVVQQLIFQEGESYPVISVSKGAKRLMTLNPTTDLNSIYSVVVEDNLISNSLNHRLGTIFSDIFTDITNNYTCQAGVEEMSGKVLCLPPQASNMLYLFTGKWSGPDGKTPPPDILRGWALESIIWKP
ncbi:DUF1131 family protein [Leucothrix pacifica]|uniref:DUF1131 domain-containing protein n=1 Tax=Leucothrix pacifica TaxID=1247513 RepID=A0A317CQJ9_9GAMM|nr:DUF1131 family protein [Leucothrix pacifica]PWQ99803.1 DUF1131 domain-containing protein [Leucothrix pacifica]